MSKLKYIREYAKVYPKRFFSILILSIVALCIIFVPYIKSFEVSNPRAAKFQKLDSAYKKFKTMTQKEFHMKYFLAVSELNVNTKNTASKFFKSIGGGFYANDEDIGQYLNGLNEIQLKYAIYDYTKIKPGDFLMFKPRWIGNKQIVRACVIEGYVNGYIRYVEYTENIGLTFNVIKYNDYSIDKVIEHNFTIWTGLELEQGTYLVRGKNYNHDGVDVVLSNYDRGVHAFFGGVVVKTFNNYNHKDRWSAVNAAGNFCIVKSNVNGITYYLQYVHLINLRVKVGDRLAQNGIIGNYADVGNNTGPHLHLGMYSSFNVKTGVLSDSQDPMLVLLACCPFVIFNKWVDNRQIVRL